MAQSGAVGDGHVGESDLDRVLGHYDSMVVIQLALDRLAMQTHYLKNEIQELQGENGSLQSRLRNLSDGKAVTIAPEPASEKPSPVKNVVRIEELSADASAGSQLANNEVDTDDKKLAPVKVPAPHGGDDALANHDLHDATAAHDLDGPAMMMPTYTLADAVEGAEKECAELIHEGAELMREVEKECEDVKKLSKTMIRKAVAGLHGHWSKAVHSHQEDVPEETHGLVPDANQLKAGVRKAVLRGTDISEFYHTGGICSRIVQSARFETMATLAIFLNSLWIAIDLDVNGKLPLFDKDTVYVFIEFLFWGYFVVEWLIRMGAFAKKMDALRDNWFVFDTLMVILSTVDLLVPIIQATSSDSEGGGGSKTSILRLLRLGKLTKMARVAKALKNWPELTILIKGLFIASRSVVSTMVLITVIVYVFSMAFRQLSYGSDSGEKFFKSVPHGMKTLLLNAAIPDATKFVDALGDDSNWIACFLVVIYFFFTSLTLLNMLIGVLCEVVSVVSCVEREAMQVAFVKGAIVTAFKDAGINLKDSINKDQFHMLLMQPGAVRGLRSAGVDPVGLVDFADYIFSGEFHGSAGGVLTLEQLIETILELGGTNSATVKDVIDARKVVIEKIEAVDTTLEAHMSHLTTLVTLLKPEPKYQDKVLGGMAGRALLDFPAPETSFSSV